MQNLPSRLNIGFAITKIFDSNFSTNLSLSDASKTESGITVKSESNLSVQLKLLNCRKCKLTCLSSSLSKYSELRIEHRKSSEPIADCFTSFIEPLLKNCSRNIALSLFTSNSDDR